MFGDNMFRDSKNVGNSIMSGVIDEETYINRYITVPAQSFMVVVIDQLKLPVVSDCAEPNKDWNRLKREKIAV